MPGKDRNNSACLKCAHERIANEILMLLRSQKKQNREVSMYEPVGVDKEGNEICMIDLMEADIEDVDVQIARQQEMKKMREVFFNCLSEKEKTVVQMRYGIFGNREYTQREIADWIGISRSYVSRIEKSALEKMRAGMEEKW